MSAIASLIAAHLPDGWELSHIIHMGEDNWEAIIRDDEYIAVGTGINPEAALAAAVAKADSGTVGRRFLQLNFGEAPVSLAEVLRLPKAQPINRRV